jgi:hypothetical protein
MREDGLRVDRLVLTGDPEFVPEGDEPDAALVSVATDAIKDGAQESGYPLLAAVAASVAPGRQRRSPRWRRLG